MSYVPAGFSDNSDNEELDGFYFEGPRRTDNSTEKSPAQILKENLVKLVTKNDVDSLRLQLDNAVEFNVDSEIDGHWNLLFYACFNAHAEVVKFLKEERGVNINLTLNSETALMVACKSKSNSEDVYKVVKLVINDSTLIGASNDSGQTALMLAAKGGHFKVVQYLIACNDAYDTLDNYGCNALFYAIEGRQYEVAKLLIETGIDLSVENKYRHTAQSFAEAENCHEILTLFPEEEYRYETPVNFMSYNRFQEIIPGIFPEKNEVPAYFPDVVCLLRGMDCEKFIPLFAQARVSLSEFLTIGDKRLEEIGILFPFQRNIIKLGLHKFFKQTWKNRSIYLPENFKTRLTPIDTIYILANALRQTTIMKCQVLHLKHLESINKSQKDLYSSPLSDVAKLRSWVSKIKALYKHVPKTSRPLFVAKKGKSTAVILYAVPLVLLSSVLGFIVLFRK